ncbi:DUF6338 family protein [Arthrobacter sp. zg-Y1143]|uniref:DUF6338 family protein n=1 Tax=Arthrobacter sp. zg-Y1143 TaxID=3049065 RepID=UPI0024C2B92C|nr:DUF6338 family protein [Arthrobacter sp. zg-Y1143]MDK1328288.1 DUF6338 family protein [Arthrobacter sp. zg-Y1143]
MFPQDLLQLLVIVGAVVPGFVYQISRRRVRGPGPDEQSITIRVLRSIATSVVFLCVYIAILDYPPSIIDVDSEGMPTSWRTAALGALFLVLGIPWLTARIVYYIGTSSPVETARLAIVGRMHLRSQWDPTPSAWDFAFSNRGAGWIRVQSSDGSWMGGWFGSSSFASSFPEPPELYLEQGYEMNEQGVFTGKMSAPDGLYIRCDDIRLLDFLPNELQAGPVVGAGTLGDNRDNG